MSSKEKPKKDELDTQETPDVTPKTDSTSEPIKDEKIEKTTNGSPEAKKEEKKEEPPEMVEIEKKRLQELEVAESKALEELKLARADAINYRKRLEKQRDEFAEYASSRVLTKLLDVRDDVMRILENGKDAIPPDHLDGIKLLDQRIQGIFDQENVKLLTVQEGKTKYDPVKHEAILAQPIEGIAPNTVITLVSSGFVKGERVLRPAKVIISQALPKPVEEVKQEAKDEVSEKNQEANENQSEKSE